MSKTYDVQIGRATVRPSGYGAGLIIECDCGVPLASITGPVSLLTLIGLSKHVGCNQIPAIMQELLGGKECSRPAQLTTLAG